MKTLIDFEDAPVFSIPVIDAFGGTRVHEGMLIEGPQGWGEFSPPLDCDDRQAARWLLSAIEAGTVGWPDPVRGRVPVSVAVPAVVPDQVHQIITTAACRTADVEVGAHPDSLRDDIARLEAVRDALGHHGAIRCNVGGRWHADKATAAIPLLANAAGGLEFIARPCSTIEDLADLRLKINVPIATEVPLSAAADIVILAVGPLGGVRRALRTAQVSGLPYVVSSTLQTSVGLAGGLALAGILPDLNSACGLSVTSGMSGDLVNDARVLVPDDGFLPVAPMPPAPDPALLAQYAMTDHARIAWWRNRLSAAQAWV